MKNALKKRVDFLENELASAKVTLAEKNAEENLEDGLADIEVVEATHLASLLPNEIDALRELIVLAEKIDSETKMTQILKTIKSYAKNESILFFTEYKATQALLITLLRAEYGHESVVFINGDEALTFSASDSEPRKENMKRELAAERFNRGEARFLVSTEAAGEGIDLQENSHVLFHADLPWNPMRLHQRLGRLHRYGQKYPVEVHLFRNPETVESRIWENLETKLAVITHAFQHMDDPEDMCQAVIGTSANSFFTDLFTNAPKNIEKLDDWFNSKASTFGGEDAVTQIRRLFGQVSRFDFGVSSANLPRVDLGDLMPYIRLTLAMKKIRPQKSDSPLKISFKTPKEYAKNINLAPQYNLVFSRDMHCGDNEDLAGLGLGIMDRLVNDGCSLAENYTPLQGLQHPLFIFRVRDRTTENKQFRQRIVAVMNKSGEWEMLRDWELLLMLNGFDRQLSRQKEVTPVGAHADIEEMNHAKAWLEQNLFPLNLPYKYAEVEPFACLCAES